MSAASGVLVQRRSRGVVGTGYLLSANNVVAAGLGFLFWVVAARRFPAADVGFAAAVAGAVTTVSGFGVLGLNSALLRYIPAYGDRWRALVVRGYGWVVLASAALAALLVVAAPRLSDQFAGLDDGGWAALAIAAAVTWSIFSLQDVALIARRRPLLVLVENAAVGIARLVALLLVSTGSDVAVTIIGVWLAPTVIAVVIVNGLLLLQGTDAGDARRAVGDGGLVRYCVFATFGSAAAALIVGFTPVIVTGVDGALANAAFFLPGRSPRRCRWSRPGWRRRSPSRPRPPPTPRSRRGGCCSTPVGS